MISILTMSGVLAIDASNVTTWHSFDDSMYSAPTSIDSHAFWNGTKVGATTGSVGRIAEAYDFDGAADYVNLAQFVNPSPTELNNSDVGKSNKSSSEW